MQAFEDPQFPGFDNYALPIPCGKDKLELKLRRAKGARRGASAALLLHGGNSSSLTYTAPSGGLADYLRQSGIDVWLLDWRASPYVVDPLLSKEPPLGGSVSTEREYFNLDRAAAEDVPTALAFVRRAIGTEPALSLMGHCLSGAVVSMAVARGLIEDYRVNSVILLALGLFVEVPWNGWLKAEDFILERILHKDKTCRGINPKRSEQWPEDMSTGLKSWPAAWLPKNTADWLRALTFMIGLPYTPERVHPELRAADTDKYFGNMHLGIYLHAGQMARRGFCAPLNEPDVIDRSRLHKQKDEPTAGIRADLVPKHFKNKHTALFAAAENRVWHRDAMDLMYEWLRNHGCSNTVKNVLPGYNLQELLWGLQARAQVYPLIEQAIRQRVHLSVAAE